MDLSWHHYKESHVGMHSRRGCCLRCLSCRCSFLFPRSLHHRSGQLPFLVCLMRLHNMVRLVLLRNLEIPRAQPSKLGHATAKLPRSYRETYVIHVWYVTALPQPQILHVLGDWNSPEGLGWVWLAMQSSNEAPTWDPAYHGMKPDIRPDIKADIRPDIIPLCATAKTSQHYRESTAMLVIL